MVQTVGTLLNACCVTHFNVQSIYHLSKAQLIDVIQHRNVIKRLLIKSKVKSQNSKASGRNLCVMCNI